MKILAIGNFEVHDYAPHWQGIKEALSGMDSLILDPRNGTNDLITIAKEFKPDIALCCTFDCVNKEELIPELKKIGAKTALWYCDYATPDDDLGRGNNFHRVEGLDYIFISNREQLKMYEDELGAEAYYMPQACLKTTFPKFRKEYIVKSVFVGCLDTTPVHSRRTEVVKEIASKTQVSKWPERDVRGCFNLLPRIYRNAKTALSVSAYNDKDLYTSNRLFLIMGNAGVCLAERFKGMEELFKIGEHLDVFDTPDEAVAKIEFYDKHVEERKKMRIKTFEYMQKYHNYNVRVKNILDIINGKEKRFNGYLRDNASPAA